MDVTGPVDHMQTFIPTIHLAQHPVHAAVAAGTFDGQPDHVAPGTCESEAACDVALEGARVGTVVGAQGDHPHFGPAGRARLRKSVHPGGSEAPDLGIDADAFDVAAQRALQIGPRPDRQRVTLDVHRCPARLGLLGRRGSIRGGGGHDGRHRHGGEGGRHHGEGLFGHRRTLPRFRGLPSACRCDLAHAIVGHDCDKARCLCAP